MFKTVKRAYTLIEMMVVMSIMAVLAILGVSAMYGANDMNVTEETAQNILSALREVQTKAISVTPDKGYSLPSHPIPKVWTVELNLNTNAYQIDSYYLPPAGTLTSYLNTAAVTPRGGVDVTVERERNGSVISTYSNGQIFFSYSTPFARPYITIGSNMVAGTLPCKWALSTRPEQDYAVSSLCSNSISSASDDVTNIIITYKNVTKVIKVKANGDAYIQ